MTRSPRFSNASGGVSASSIMKPFAVARTEADVDISLTVSPIKNAQGIIVGASKIARDISDRKRSEAQITILAREAEHRAKNVLATVQATVHLSQSDTPEGLKHAIEGRIQALANVHPLFVQSRWTGAELRSLVTQELSPYAQDGRDARADRRPERVAGAGCGADDCGDCARAGDQRGQVRGTVRSRRARCKSSGRALRTDGLSCAGPRPAARRSIRRRAEALARA